MSERPLWLDGNAIAGLLNDAFGMELTATQRGCQSCGALTCVGAHRVYRGAGTVLRCPACGELALRVTSLPDRYVVLLAGTWALELPLVDRREQHSEPPLQAPHRR